MLCKRVMVALLALVSFSCPVYAARSFFANSFPVDDLSCQGISTAAGQTSMGTPTCTNLKESLAQLSSADRQNIVIAYERFPLNVMMTVTGECTAKAPAGEPFIPLRFVQTASLSGNEVIVQTIRGFSQVTGSIAGCKVYGSDEGTCFYTKVSSTISRADCSVKLLETGERGEPGNPPDDSAPDYGGGTDPGPGGTAPGDGGGTAPGGGGSPGGAGGGGGGGSPGGGGGGGGGGGSSPGGGGGGGSDGGGGGGGGGGGTGDNQANCGAPGQAPCSINEGSTPTGAGGLMDGLMKLVDGIGEGRQNGIDDAKSDSGKNTSLTNFSVNIPTGVCSNPTVSLPNMSRTYTVDVCQYVGLLRVAFDALWAFAFVVGVVSLVGRATAKPVA